MLERFAALSEAERSARFSLWERLAMLEPGPRRRFLAGLPARLRGAFLSDWYCRARRAQIGPDGDWRIWLIMAGRGFGKTRAGAEWVLGLAEQPALRIALVGPTDEEARAVMVEGASGILACAGRSEPPQWEPSLGRLTWPSGSRATLYSGAHPDGLRGPEHDFAWCDEVAKWARAEAAWDNMSFGLRRGARPQVLATTTPRPTPLMRRLAALPGVAVTRGRTADNAVLAESFVEHVTALYGGTRLGRQELDGELIDDAEGSLWPRALIERCRAGTAAGDIAVKRVVVAVDPPVSVGGDACGISVCALGEDGIGYVLEDATVAGLRPEGWAQAVAAAAARWHADRVVAEGNQGGAMVESVLRGAAVNLPVKIVHARHGKVARAEPVAALFEGRRAKFAGAFPELEDQLAGLTSGGGYEGPGRSPDRADAMVWALTELMLGKKRAEPRITVF
ncbi:MAG TPA: terminase family protein [Allosphingosinicella sp.]|nr:terminase family protein [Allosphingosinicella sp.]